jgi:hypothetical protein
MRLYVISSSGQKIYLSEVAPTRFELSHRLGSRTFDLGNEQFDVNEVNAEPGSNSAVGGAVAGSLIGLIAGPLGLLIGVGLGTLIGGGIQNQEYSQVNSFNHSEA